MKKALFVLGLALCSTFAYAQTCDFNINVEKTALQRNVKPTSFERPVDYKASIFTKDTVIYRCEFSAAEWAADVTTGVISATDVIDGAASTPHGQTGALQQWHRVPDSASFVSTTGDWANVGYKSYIINRVRPYYAGNDNGFAFMALAPAAELGSGAHNAWIKFPAVARPADVNVIDIRFLQGYIKFYDKCFIDYKIGNNWKSREINVEGVDLEVNTVAAMNANFTMPLELGQQANIEVRVRYFADGTSDGTPVTAYGYIWGFDNFRIVGADADRWYTNSQKFLDGFYGTMPQNMSIPITWYGEIVNNGGNTRTNVSYSIEHIDANLIGTPIINETANPIAANPTNVNYMIVDERGFFSGEQANRPGSGVFEAGNIGGSHLGMWWYGPNYGATNINAQQYGLTGLPTTDLGQQFFAATAQSDGAETIAWDTVAYQVVGETGGDGALEIAGFRWGKDNGIIPSDSRYSFGFGANAAGQQYVTDECDYWSSAQYTVMGRFTTGNTIPANWVFRGMELIPQTVDGLGEIENSKIYPMMWEAVYIPDSNDWELEDVATGASTTTPHTVTLAELNNLPTGRIAPSDPYNAVNLQFFNQPELKPNTSYYIGYQLATDGKFAVARQQYYFLGQDGESTVRYYQDANPEVANGYYQFTPGPYDMYVYTPGFGGYFAGYNTDYSPMIRPIVGPRVELPEYHINATCGNGVVIEDEAEQTICGGYATSFQGASPTVYIIPDGIWCDTCTGAYKIDINSITVDGQVADLDGENSGFSINEGAYNVRNADEEIVLNRSYYAITFDAIGDHHSVSASATFNPWQHGVGIDPAAMNVCLGLQPNPATSSVKLNISGVSGMVSCSIIDMSGRVVYNADINAEQQQVIDLSNVAAGAYFVRVTNDNFSKVEKLIVR